MIMKLLLVLGVISIVYIFFIKEKPKKDIPKKEQDEVIDEMLKCPTCGVYCEVSEMILSNGVYYCSKECIKD